MTVSPLRNPPLTNGLTVWPYSCPGVTHDTVVDPDGQTDDQALPKNLNRRHIHPAPRLDLLKGSWQ
jgi:hypothetical protein